jgi:hypothetical protein
MYSDAVDVTPSNTADIATEFVSDGLWVGGTGNVNVILASGKTHLFTAVAANTLLPFRVRRVLATSTTATLIKACKL